MQEEEIKKFREWELSEALRMEKEREDNYWARFEHHVENAFVRAFERMDKKTEEAQKKTVKKKPEEETDDLAIK